MAGAPHTVFDNILDLAFARDETRRSTLVRVLVDGFCRDEKPRSAREARQFAELMGHLLDHTDGPTRTAIARKLAGRMDVPMAIVERLAADQSATAESLIGRKPVAEFRLDMPSAPEREPADAQDFPADAQSFLAASPDARRAMLAALATTALPVPHGAASPQALRTLVRHAVLRQRAAFVEGLAMLLGTSVATARQVAEDADGLPLVLAARALDLDEGAAAQILLLVNPAVGESFARVTALRDLFRVTSRDVAVAITEGWREAPPAPRHAPVHAGAVPLAAVPTVVLPRSDEALVAAG